MRVWIAAIGSALILVACGATQPETKPSGTKPNESVPAGRTYRVEVDETNLILDTEVAAKDYLRQGLRAEAIQHAEIQPDLLGLVRALDMSGLTEWDMVCLNNELDRPSRLLLDVAKEIEEQMTYPGEIRVTVLREVRAVSMAR